MSLHHPPIKSTTENQIVLSKEFVSSKKSLYSFIMNINRDFVFQNDHEKTDVFLDLHNDIKEISIPKMIQKRFWLQLYSKTNAYLVTECMTPDREWKWVTTTFEARRNEENEILNYLIIRNTPSKRTINNIKSLYEKLINIERTMGVEVANNYFNRLLLEKNKTYDQYMKELCLPANRVILDVNFHRNNAIPAIS